MLDAQLGGWNDDTIPACVADLVQKLCTAPQDGTPSDLTSYSFDRSCHGHRSDHPKPKCSITIKYVHYRSKCMSEQKLQGLAHLV